jgi:mycofactocin precursor
MTEPITQQQPTSATVPTAESPVTDDEMLTSEMLVEEVSIDGMCGVY